MVDLASAQKEFNNYFQQSMDSYFQGETRLMEAVRYASSGEGKRLRPLLVQAAAKLGAGDLALAQVYGVALEMIHTYSLVHDDLPAMDDDDLRRGRPTVHKAYDEATAVLVGDALLGEAGPYILQQGELLGADKALLADAVFCLLDCAGPRGMVQGQALDLEAENSGGDEKLLKEIHRLKTGKLLQAALVLGSLTWSDPNEREKFRQPLLRLGEIMGLAFQMVDDILDVTSSSEVLGKTAGKDIEANKLTYPALIGLDQTRHQVGELKKEAENLIDSFEKSAESKEMLIVLLSRLVDRVF